MPNEKKIIPNHGLNHKQLLFAEFIVVGKSQREAYRLAGYSAKTDEAADSVACEMLRNPKVQRYIADRRPEIEKALQEKTLVTKEEILNELKSVGFAKITDFLSFDEHGVVMKDSDEISKDKIGAIKEVESVTTQMLGDEGEKEVLRVQTKFKLHDKINSLIKLGEGLGYFKQNAPVQQNIQVNIRLIGSDNGN